MVFTVVLVMVTMLPLAGRSGATYSLIMLTAGAFFAYQTVRYWLGRIPECWPGLCFTPRFSACPWSSEP